MASHKDHSVLDGGKGKQITSQRSYPSGVPDSTESALPASALPASAHWSVGRGGGEGAWGDHKQIEPDLPMLDGSSCSVIHSL